MLQDLLQSLWQGPTSFVNIATSGLLSAIMLTSLAKQKCGNSQVCEAFLVLPFLYCYSLFLCWSGSSCLQMLWGTILCCQVPHLVFHPWPLENLSPILCLRHLFGDIEVLFIIEFHTCIILEDGLFHFYNYLYMFVSCPFCLYWCQSPKQLTYVCGSWWELTKVAHKTKKRLELVFVIQRWYIIKWPECVRVQLQTMFGYYLTKEWSSHAPEISSLFSLGLLCSKSVLLSVPSWPLLSAS